MTDGDFTPESTHCKWIEAHEPEWLDALVWARYAEIPFGASISTDRGLDWLNKYASDEPQPGWNAKILPLIAIGIILALVVGVVLSAGATAVTQPEATELNQPENMLLIPGLNSLIPMSAGLYVLITILISAAFHEFIHAVFGLKHGCEIESYGILLVGPIPMGAFVKPEDDAHEALPPWPKMEVFASAPLSNIWLAGVFYVVGVNFPGTPNDATLAKGFEAWMQAASAGEITTLVPVYGHPVTDLCIWGTMISLNLGLLNLLPVGPLDGGRVLQAAVKAFSDRFGFGNPSKLSRGVTYATIALFAFVLFAPLVLW